jgi:hypothetical protein
MADLSALHCVVTTETAARSCGGFLQRIASRRTARHFLGSALAARVLRAAR